MKRKYANIGDVVSGTGCLPRLKQNCLYNSHMGTKAAFLRVRVRRRGYKRWYCLKKCVLAAVLTFDTSVRVITGAFRLFMQKKRDLLIARQAAGGEENKCPICLTPLQDLSNLFVHDGIVFCKQDVIAYVSSGYNFNNPITRKHLSSHDVDRLGCKRLVDSYSSREALRRRVVDSSTHFFFLENDVVEAYRDLLSVVHVSGTRMFSEQIFRDVYLRFDSHVRQMFANDSTRTICVLKGLRNECRGMDDLVQKWSLTLIDGYLRGPPQPSSVY